MDCIGFDDMPQSKQTTMDSLSFGSEVRDYGLGARISRAWARILDHAIAFHEAQPPLRTGKRGRKKRRIGHNLALRLRKHKEGCLRSLTDPRTPFTNNEAERDLRMAKLRQKISGGFRSERGAYNFARMRAVIATARKQGWNVLQTLVPDASHQAPPNWTGIMVDFKPSGPSARPATVAVALENESPHHAPAMGVHKRRMRYSPPHHATPR